MGDWDQLMHRAQRELELARRTPDAATSAAHYRRSATYFNRLALLAEQAPAPVEELAD